MDVVDAVEVVASDGGEEAVELAERGLLVWSFEAVTDIIASYLASLACSNCQFTSLTATRRFLGSALTLC